MTRVSFLAHLPDPFGVQDPYYLVLDSKDQMKSLTAQELTEYDDKLITFDFPGLIDGLRVSSASPPENLIDIGDALRICVGRPKDEGGEKQWDILAALRRSFADPVDGNTFHKLAQSKIRRPSDLETQRLLKEMLRALAALWQDLSERLKQSGEWERLITVEWPVQRIFVRRQYSGIKLDPEVAKGLLDKVAERKYNSYREVAEALNANPTGLNFWNVGPLLKNTDVAYLNEMVDPRRLQDSFKIAASNSKFAASFLDLVDSQRDEAVLRRAFGVSDDHRIHPVFHVMGTITGRILVSDPYIQNLRRAFRSVVVPSEGSKLVYLDYAQFEPGILAGLSEDENLTEAYNGGDIYNALAEELFHDPSQRPLAKRVFLAFSYGMTAERLASMLSGNRDLDTGQQEYERKLKRFFDSFPGIEGFSRRLESELIENGYVSSLLGNRRYRSELGPLSFKERRWALNHPVQSTASLVFKEALSAIAEAVGEKRIVLPMHDAVVLEFDDDESFDWGVEIAKSKMEDAFTNRFPSIEPRITVGSFGDS